MKYLTAITSLLILSACSSPDLWERKKPAVHYMEATETLAATSEIMPISADDQEQLDMFLNDIPATSIDGVRIETPHALNSPAITSIQQILSAHRIPAGLIATAPAAAGGDTLITVSYAVAVAPQCPDWSSDSSGNVLNAPGSYFSCASASNISAMIAHPQDLVKGSNGAPPDGERNLQVMERYRAGAFNQETTRESVSE